MTATWVTGPAVLAVDHGPPVADGSQAWPAPTEGGIRRYCRSGP